MIGGAGGAPAELEPVWIASLGQEARLGGGLQHRIHEIGVLEHQPRAGTPIEDLGPQRDGQVGQLGGVDEGAEGDVALGQAGRRRGPGARVGAEGAAGVAHAPDLLVEQGRHLLARGEVGLDHIVDRRDPGGLLVVEPAGLDRRRAQREHGQAVAGVVAPAVDQDVDAVGPDQLGRLGVIEPGEAAHLERGGEGRRILGLVGIGEDRDLGWIVMVEDGGDELARLGLDEARGDVADAQGPALGAEIGEGRRRARRRMDGGPAAGGCGMAGGAVFHREQGRQDELGH